MTFKQRTLLALVVVLGGMGVFGAGIWTGGYATTHLPVHVADGYVGEDQASFEVGDTTYGFESSVNWTDNLGVFHDSGWPACLPKLSPVKGVHLAVATFWTGQFGVSQVVWIDCQGR